MKWNLNPNAIELCAAIARVSELYLIARCDTDEDELHIRSSLSSSRLSERGLDERVCTCPNGCSL